MNNGDALIDEEEALRQYLPNGFGKQTKEANIAAQIERTKRLSTATTIKDEGGHQDADDGSDGDSESEGDSDPEDDYPVSHELVLNTHERTITTLTVDPSGSRMISGSTDCTVKLHDFASMTPTTLRAFKSVDPTAAKA
ncbi:MAG: hypothetical protein Q9187_004997, partial [Circinaria calcarea]